MDVRVPPHATDAEQAVIGALLLEGSLIASAAAFLRPGDFYASWAATVFAAMLDLHGAGRQVDAVTVAARLRETGRWNEALEANLAEAARSVPSAAALLDYATAVYGLARRRDAIQAAARLKDALHSSDLAAIGVAGLELRRCVEAVEGAALGSPPHMGVGWEQRIAEAFRTAGALVAEGGTDPEWVAEPWAAKGTITGIDGLPKGGGKTTFVLLMIAAVLDGLPFLGRPTTRTRVVYLTEEPRASFVAGLRRAGLLERDDLFILRRQDIPGAPWPAIAKAALAYCQKVGAGLLVVDTFPPFAGLRGDDENSAGAMLAAIEPLYAVTAAGLAVILTRHERKAQGEPGSSGRGSNAFTGAVETVITIRRTKRAGSPNVRELACLSRFDEVPAELSIELTAKGYVVVGHEPECRLDNRFLAVAPKSEAEAKTEAELTALVKVSPSSVNRALNQLLKEGRLLRKGKGGKGSPFRYWAPDIHGSFPSAHPHKGEENNAGEGKATEFGE